MQSLPRHCFIPGSGRDPESTHLRSRVSPETSEKTPKNPPVYFLYLKAGRQETEAQSREVMCPRTLNHLFNRPTHSGTNLRPQQGSLFRERQESHKPTPTTPCDGCFVHPGCGNTGKALCSPPVQGGVFPRNRKLL